MRSVISTLLGLFLYAQVICGDGRCKNEHWLEITQSSRVPAGHTHEIPEASEQAVVFVYHEDCPQCISTMKKLVDGGGSFVDITETGIKGALDLYEERMNLDCGSPKNSNNQKLSSRKLYPQLPKLSNCLYPTPKLI